MANIRIVGKKGSRACKAIRDNTGIPGIFKKTPANMDAIINYGLAGQKLDRFFRLHPKAKSVPMLNKYVGRSKYLAVKDAQKAGILCPESRLELPARARTSLWIEKKVNSAQGKGIRRARGRNRIPGKYYQKMVKDRKFELRVHAFMWVPQDQWRLNKRHGPADQIAWNFHQGGHFSSVHYPNKYKVFLEAKEISSEVLRIRSMAFGAVDLIVDHDMNVYFIEVNASPGFEELNQQFYFDAFKSLKAMSRSKVRSFCNR
jgi:hypothetical protein